MLLFTKEELLSQRISDIHPEEMPVLQSFIQSIFKEGFGYTEQLTYRRKDAHNNGGLFLAAQKDSKSKRSTLSMMKRRAAQMLTIMCC